MPNNVDVNLAGQRVLIVEDDPLIAMLMEDILFALECAVVGPASNLATAYELLQSEEYDVAILDVNLGTETSLPLADVLKRSEVPFAFATGYGAGDFANDAHVLNKPYSFSSVSEVLRKLVSEKNV